MFCDALACNLRQAARSLLKSPGYLATSLLTLALGIGLSTASFCTIDSLVLRHLPYPQSEDLRCLFRTSKREYTTFFHSPAAFIDLRAQSRSFSEISTWNAGSLDLVHNGAPAEQIGACNVSGNFFDLLRFQPERGRGFTAADEKSGAPKVVVITHRMWQRRFGGDPAILGKALRLSRESYEVVGVLPAAFEVPAFWGNIEIFYPFQIHPNFATMRDTRWLEIIARTAPGVTRTQAQSELDLIAERQARDFPKEHAGDGLQLRDIRTAYWRTPGKVVTGMMIGLSALLLLATCINLAGLQLVRCLARKRELAVRCALGANRWQEMSPLVLESILLALGGGFLGLLVANWANAILGRFILFNSTLPMTIPLDARALVVAAGIAIISGLGFGLLPALFAARTRPIEALNEVGRSGTESRSDGRIRRVLIVAEIAIALMLVSTASVFASACASLTHRRLGWNAAQLYHAATSLPWDPYAKNIEQGRRLVDNLQRDLTALPGVSHAAIANYSPLWGFYGQTGFVVDGRAVPDPGREPNAYACDISLDYFATLEIPLLRGRDFTTADHADHTRVAIVNRALANSLWPDTDPIGQRLRLVGDQDFAEIVGIVGDTAYAWGYERPPTRFQVYFPLAQRQAGAHPQVLLLRTRDDPASYADAVRRTVAALDPDLALTQTGALPTLMRQGNRLFDTIAGNLVVFALVALLIAAIGIYGVIANLTAMRLHSIAIRVALGAVYRDIMRMILGNGLRLVGAGLLAGCALTYALIRVLATQIPGMDFPGAWIIAIGMFLLATVGLLACWLPAHRAARVDPLIALREE